MAIRSRMGAMMDPRVHAPTRPSSPSKGVRLLHANSVSISLDRMQFTRLENRMPEGERFDQAMFVRVLKIEGKCSRLRAKAAHYSGHLPPGRAVVVIGPNVRRNQPQSSNAGFKVRS